MLGLEEAKGGQAIFEPSKVMRNWMSKYHLAMTFTVRHGKIHHF